MVDMKPTVYGIFLLFCLVIGFVVLGILLPADSEATELFDDFGNKVSSFFTNQNEVREKSESYFDDEFVPMFNDCIDSKKTGCWCSDDKLDLPNGYFMEIVAEGPSETVVYILDQDGGRFAENPFVSEVCFVTKDLGSSIPGKFKDQKVVIKLGRTPYMYYELNEFEKESPFAQMWGMTGENKAEVVLDKLFYKVSEDMICVYDKASAGLVGTDRVC